MIIPIKCFTCGKVIADKYLYYKKELGKKGKGDKLTYFDENNVKKQAEGVIMDKLGLNKICCRRHFLTHVDIE
tara:strand:+ start:165 stop:383 length:219 start_codon:yes stop_codon:yes gene_type:complete